MKKSVLIPYTVYQELKKNDSSMETEPSAEEISEKTNIEKSVNLHGSSFNENSETQQPTQESIGTETESTKIEQPINSPETIKPIVSPPPPGIRINRVSKKLNRANRPSKLNLSWQKF